MARPIVGKVGHKVRVAAENRKARHNFHIEDTVEAGITLQGTEVKSLRFGDGNIADSYAEVRNGEAFLVNAYIPEFTHGNRYNHEPRRPRKLLLNRKEINRMQGAIMRQGMTLIPLAIYFNDRGRAKVELGLARGKKLYDKRQDQKSRDWERQKARLLRDKG
ncbi:MAG: SsrA-binding protein SmpB [Pseudomonadota bacterium]